MFLTHFIIFVVLYHFVAGGACFSWPSQTIYICWSTRCKGAQISLLMKLWMVLLFFRSFFFHLIKSILHSIHLIGSHLSKGASDVSNNTLATTHLLFLIVRWFQYLSNQETINLGSIENLMKRFMKNTLRHVMCVTFSQKEGWKQGNYWWLSNTLFATSRNTKCRDIQILT